MRPDWPAVARDVAARYAGRSHRGFVAGKLRHDPVYAALAADPELAAAPRVADLGCGRGILLAVLAEHARRSGSAPELRGVEQRSSHAEVAAAALGEDARIVIADLRVAEVPPCDAACLIDVLHYLPAEAQAPLLARVAGALPAGGLLLVREVDGEAGIAGGMARAAEHLASALRGEPRRRLAFRSAAGWRDLLEEVGFTVGLRSMDEGTPFANVLLVGRLEGGRAARLPTGGARTAARP